MEVNVARSEALFTEAQQVIPGGVNSPVRAFRGVGGTPRFISRGEGAYVVDVDGNRYIDYVLSWGPLILGHANPSIISAITRQAKLGTSFGAPTALETELAERIIRLMPAVEMVRFVSSGTEAVMSAVRLARTATKRAKILKFAGCYHGHADMLLVQAGSGVATLGLPDSPGVTASTTADTLTVPFNDLAAVEDVFASCGSEIAAILVEPVAGNMGMVAPVPGFLEGLRAVADRSGALLIFDEVMTGFRVALSGAQGYYGITPDITCLGKVIGGGLPAAAYGGRREIMSMVAPAGPMYQAGTLSGNPLAMVAGIATLDALVLPGVHDRLSSMAASLASAVLAAGDETGVPVQATAIGSMWGFFLNDQPVVNYEVARTSNIDGFGRLFHSLLAEGVYIAPSQFEASFVSTAHDAVTLEETTRAFSVAMRSV